MFAVLLKRKTMIRQERLKGRKIVKVGKFTAETQTATRTYKTGGSCLKVKSSKQARTERQIEAVYNGLESQAKKYDANAKRLRQLSKRNAKRKARKVNK